MTTESPPLRPAVAPLLALVGLLAAELAVIGVTYKHLIRFTCLENWPAAVCGGASTFMVSVYAMAAALALVALLIPEAVRQLAAEAGLRRAGLLPNLAGFAAMMAPLPLLAEGAGTAVLPVVLACWGMGILLGATGALLMVAPLARWRVFLAAQGGRFALAAVAGLLAPILAMQVRPLWRLETMADLTFSAVAGLIRLLGYEVAADPVAKTIGAAGFSISVAPVCSGIEGMGLVAVFVTLFLGLFRHELRFPAALLLYPIGIVASAALNILRITLLLVIGLNGHPGLAVGGFHSHAGWLSFTLLSLGLILAARSLAVFARLPRPAAQAPRLPPFLADPMVAGILPFAVFMASALLASTFSASPETVYPLRVLAMAGVLALFLPHLRSLGWRVDPLALGLGVGIGLLWALTGPAPGPGSLPAQGTLAGAGLALWILSRVIGTALLVPVIEELFFRGYLLDRLAPPGSRRPWRVLLAVAVSSAAFAVLHDRWLAAGLAGVAFALLALRSRNLTDAILAHAAANAVIAGVALATGNWGLI
ncbi:exosortase E/protease, VPEID-CTERM system [Rhodobacter sp. CZR27]|uniref:exosortase E/protease, VPEID-CTERM system n=1 Tax=Rhodobacter sp. CZR27 TaxID=2033869 RepID=UPI000BBEF301|nr:exosortase E/protease, VPEID-CTERM system [Rhodobacter sp. CZR27]